MSGFETAKVTLQVKGDYCHTVIVDNISPAEYKVLQHFHGADSVVFLEKTGHLVKTKMTDDGRLMTRATSMREHREDLQRKYRKKYDEVFTGIDPKLPVNFSEISVKSQDDVGEDLEDTWVFADAPVKEDKLKAKGA